MRRAAVVVASMVASTIGTAHAGNALDKPAFTAKPEELLAAAKAAPAGTDAVILRDDHDITFDTKGRTTTRTRLVFVVLTQAGADDWANLITTWRPFYQDKPVMRARVIDASGHAVELDPSTLTDHADTTGPQGSSDTRELDAALPHLSVGSVVEEEVNTIDRDVFPGGGSFVKRSFGMYTIPTSSTRVQIIAPAGAKLHLAERGLPAATHPQRTSANGSQRIVYAFGAFPGYQAPEQWLPGDVVAHPYVTVSMTPSWQAVARAYRALVEPALADAGAKVPTDLPKTATAETAVALATWLQRNIHFNDVWARDSTYKPALPSQTMHAGSGGEQEIAVLLVALLRQAGLHAELVLVDAGPGHDLDREVPGLDAFNRLLVRVKLATDLWIDPVDDRAVPGELAYYLQGRRALVVADESTDLIVTPVSRPEDNSVREVRTFTAAESGAATITEVSRERGLWDREQRGWYRTTLPAEVRKALESYVKDQYAEAALQSYSATDANDPAKPFELTVTATASKRVYAHRDQIDVYLFPQDALAKLPKLLDHPADDEPARKHDLQVSRPFVSEIETRIVVPPGFSLPAPAPEKKRTIGPWSLVERQTIDGNTFVVTFHFETTKLRLTPSEVADVQQAARAIHKEPAEHLVLENTGVALLQHGKAKEAIAEIERLVKLHPKEGIHHGELARVYLAVGAAAAARREAKRGVDVEPTAADHHVVFAWILSYDLFGRRYQGDYDRAGAIAELQKARQLNPKHAGAARELGQLLMRSPEGRTYDPGSDLAGAAEAFRTAYALDPSVDNGLDAMRTLLYGDKAAAAEQFGKPLASGEARDTLYIAAIAAARGAKAAIQEASSLSTPKSKVFQGAAGVLLLVRQFDAARDLAAEAKLLTPGSASAQTFAKSKRTTPAALVTPEAVAMEGVVASLGSAKPPHVYWDATVASDVRAVGRKTVRKIPNNDMMTLPLMNDITRSLMTTKTEGDEKAWRVEVEELGKKGFVYLTTDGGAPKILGTNDAATGVGRYVLKLLARSDEDTATRLLDWVEKDITPRMGSLFLRVWGGNLPRTRQAIELAAAVLADESGFKTTLPTLEKCGASTTDGQWACDLLVARILYVRKNWSDLEQHTQDWSKRVQSEPLPAAMRVTALHHLGRHEEAEKLATDLRAAFPDVRIALMAHVESAVLAGNVIEAIRRMRVLTQVDAAKPLDFNNLAWLELYEGSVLPGALADAQKSIETAVKDASALHTLACVEAEVGNLTDAAQHLQESMAARDDDHGTDSALYVQARILEQLGMTADALATYKRIKPSANGATFYEVSDFAAKRIKLLTSKK